MDRGREKIESGVADVLRKEVMAGAGKRRAQ